MKNFIPAGSSLQVRVPQGKRLILVGNGTFQSITPGALESAVGLQPIASPSSSVFASRSALVVNVRAESNVGIAIDSGTVGTGLRLQNVLTRNLTGRANAVVTSSTVFTGSALVTGLTQHQRVVLASQFDSVRIGIPNMHTSSVANVLAAVGISNALGAWNAAAPTLNNTGAATAAVPTPTETVSASPGVWRNMTFSGQASATLPAAADAANLLPSMTWSDWCPVSSVPRVDGGTLPVLDIRLFIPVAAGSITLGWTGVSNTAWAISGRDDLFTNGRAYRVWNQDTNGVTTPANFTQTVTTSTVIPIYIEYRSRRLGLAMGSLGDSIYDATAGATYPSDSFIFKAVNALHTDAVPVEYFSLNAAGATSIQLATKGQLLLPQIPTGLLVFEPASINNFGTSLGSRTQQEGLGAAGVVQQLSEQLDFGLMLCSMLPVTNAARNWGATDAQRRDLNNNLQNFAAQSGAAFCDFSPYINGPVVSGQIEPLPALISPDGFHENDAGQIALGLAVQAAAAPLLDAAL